MSKLRVSCLSLSIDGFAAGPNQSFDNPLGQGGLAVFQWFFATDAFRRRHGAGETVSAGPVNGPDNDFALRGFTNIGAWILGRNMFGPLRGDWPDDAWKGWWGDDPPFRVPTFVLTHHPRKSIAMQGGTTFHFVTGGIHEALARATEAAGGQDVRLGCGVATIRQYLLAGLVDELHLAISPVLLGTGEHLLQGIDLPQLGFRVTEHVPAPAATHLVLTRQP